MRLSEIGERGFGLVRESIVCRVWGVREERILRNGGWWVDLVGVIGTQKVQCTIVVWLGGVGKCMCFLGEAMRLGNKFYPDVLASQAFIGAFKVVVAVGASCVCVWRYFWSCLRSIMLQQICAWLGRTELLGKGPSALKWSLILGTLLLNRTNLLNLLDFPKNWPKNRPAQADYKLEFWPSTFLLLGGGGGSPNTPSPSLVYAYWTPTLN